MHIYFCNDPDLPAPLVAPLSRLQEALRARGLAVDHGPAAGAPNGAVTVTTTASPPAHGIWLRWDHAALIASGSIERARTPEGVAVLEVGPWLGADHAGIALPIPTEPHRPSGGTAPVRIAVLGEAAEAASVHQACELAGAAGLDAAAVDAASTQISDWAALVCTPSGFHRGGFAIVLEAIARGVPTILPDLPPIRSRAASAALFCAFEDQQELAEAIVLVGLHPEIRGALSDNGRAWAEPHCSDGGADLLAATARSLRPQESTPREQPKDRHALTAQLKASLQQLAELYREADEWAEARAHLEAAHLLDGEDDPNQLDRLAYARYLAGDDIGALAIYDQLLNSRDAAIQETRGMILIGLGRFEDAAAALRDALRTDAPTAALHNSLGYALHRTGDAEGAAAQFREALRLDPAHAEARDNLATLA